ncbi:DoxX family protein [Winogradskyella maritima]|uniref:DoxX family protein n=1 Tax=Winogradskyella maritima TaxID=1517766 RepID=A0ABV8AIU1_9FLAO|nr:DoxX family protein [Winogradskyella maritima]
MLLSQVYTEQWSNGRKLLLRWLFSYFSLYIFMMFASGLFATPFKWIGQNILGFTYDFSVSGNGSGDNTYAYVTLFVNLVLAFLITAIWTVTDRKRPSYNHLMYWFILMLRFTLFVAMFVYGFVKVFQIQFGFPSLSQLLEPIGNMTPMGLAWTYMGYSKGFGMFAGLMEVIGGLLLISRRTQTLGAFIIIGVMTHVFLMNMMFDIPVKLLSLHLILMALVIFLADIKRFISVFITNKSTEAHPFFHPNSDPTYFKILPRIKTGCILFLVGIICFMAYPIEKKRRNPDKDALLYGIWEAKTFIKNGDTLVPLVTDKDRWRYFIVESKKRAVAKTMTDGYLGFEIEVDTALQTLALKPIRMEGPFNTFSFEQPTPLQLNIQGKLGEDAYTIHFQKKNIENFNLVNTGFHWISERPNNR